MLPIHARSRDEYVELARQHSEAGDKRALGEILAQAIDDYDGDEEFSAWAAGIAHGSGTANAPELLARFIERHPESLHPVQVDWAEGLLWQGRVDEGSNEARAWLSRAARGGLPERFRSDEMLRHGGCRALLILTAVYTEMGARTYSRRVLEGGLMLEIDPYWKRRFASEHHRLCEELRAPALAAADAKWERFFASGEAAADLVRACEAKKFPILARRIQVLAQKFADQSGWKPGEDELFQLVYRTDKGAFVLA